MRFAALFAVLSGVLSLVACEPQAPDYAIDDDSGVANATTSGAAGSATATTGGSGSAEVCGSNLGAAGDAVGAGGTGNLAGAAGAGTDAAVSTSQDAAKAEGGGAVDVTATATFRGSPGGSAAFKQHGVDVTVTVKVTNCSMGNHPIFIYDGYSCDSNTTEGAKWDGARANLADSTAGSVVACKADKTGLLTYMRPGADMATRWTVSDHNVLSDVSTHVVVISDVDNEAVRQSCADFR